MDAAVGVLLLGSLVTFSISSAAHGLSLNYYDKTCPQAEAIITNVVKKAVSADKKVPAALLRMHFHDCFIRVISLSLSDIINHPFAGHSLDGPICIFFFLRCEQNNRDEDRVLLQFVRTFMLQLVDSV